MLSPVFDAFVEASPVSVMMRGLMEHIFNSERINQIFNTKSERQYEQELSGKGRRQRAEGRRGSTPLLRLPEPFARLERARV
jgi:hypothetical protein